MITIPSEYLDNHWAEIISNSIHSITLSEWDDGDAYTLSSVGQFPSTKQVSAAIIIGNAEVPGVPIVIHLNKTSPTNKTDTYMAPDGSSYVSTAQHIITPGNIRSIKVAIVDIVKALNLRRKGFLESDLLKDSIVTIIGLGTGGIQAALDLAKSGVGNFHLIDSDRLDIGNVSRHQAGISCVGRKKVFAARDLIIEKNLKANVTTYPILACEENKEILVPIIEKSDLIVCATDSRQSKLLINSLCVTAKKPAIYGGAFRRAYGGNVLRVHESACYHCFVLAMSEKETDQEVSSEENANEIAYSDMPVSIEPGLSIDVAPIATMVSKLALQELIVNKESTLHVLDKDFEANWYFWINRPEPKTEYASLVPLSESYNEMTILRWYAVTLDKDPDCPTCGNFNKSLTDKYGLNLKEISVPIAPPNFPKKDIK